MCIDIFIMYSIAGVKHPLPLRKEQVIFWRERVIQFVPLTNTFMRQNFTLEPADILIPSEKVT